MTTTTFPTPDIPPLAARSAWIRAATRTRLDDIAAVPALLRSEWIKLSSVRANKAILGLTTAVGGVVSWAVAKFVTDEVQTVSEVFIFSTVLTAVFSPRSPGS